MRIVAGRWRGRTLAAPEGSVTRPTSDRVREAMFSSLDARLGGLEGERVLDLFAGSGALGLEALSRGAEHAIFVEEAHGALAALKSNIAALCAGAQCRVVRADAFSRRLPSQLAPPVSLLFLDPPYRIVAAQVRDLLEALTGEGVLRPGAVIAYEHRSGRDFDWPRGFAPYDSRAYGDTTIEYAVWDNEGDVSK